MDNQNFQKSLADILKHHRLEKGFKQAELAEKLCRPQSYVSKIEKAEKRLDIFELFCFAKALDVDINLLIKEINKKI